MGFRGNRSPCAPRPGQVLGVGIALVVMGCAWSDPAHLEVPPDAVERMFVEASTLQPALRWPPIPHPHEAAAAPAAQGAARSPVTYDLRIWRAENGYPVALVYERVGLLEISHRIEEVLEPSTDYVWSVRARFEIAGHGRVSDWVVTQAPRLPLVPHPFFVRFRTPR